MWEGNSLFYIIRVLNTALCEQPQAPPHSIILFPNTQFCPILSCLRIFLDLSVLTSVMSSYAAKDIPTERKTRVKRERRKMLTKKSPVIDHSPASEGSAASKQGRTYKLFLSPPWILSFQFCIEISNFPHFPTSYLGSNG